MVDAVVRKSDMVMLESITNGRARPKLTLNAIVQKDLGLLDIMKHDALNIKTQTYCNIN